MQAMNYIALFFLFISSNGLHEAEGFLDVFQSDVRSIYYSWADFLNHVREEGLFGQQTTFDKAKTSFDPEINMTALEIVRYHGYIAEEHDIVTQDGFILTMHRIPHGKTGCANAKKIPVLVQHGAMTSSIAWFINTPDKNLVYLLADAGYDVWLGNIRGNVFGHRHVNVSSEDSEFWKFSIDEHGKYDLPAMIDYVLNTTGFDQLYYIGFSMGTTMMYQLMATRLEYNDKVHTAFHLAPAGSGLHVRSVARLLRPLWDAAYYLGLMKIGHHFSSPFASKFCGSSLKFLCRYMFHFLNGFSSDQFNSTRLPLFVSTIGNTSWLFLHHSSQVLRTTELKSCDYDPQENLKRYGQEMPPVYNLSKITTPIALFWSENDYLANPTNVKLVSQQLKSVFLTYRVPLKTFSHIDFVWGIDSKTLVYDKIINEMKQRWIFG